LLLVGAAVVHLIAFAVSLALHRSGRTRRAWQWDVAACALLVAAIAGCFWRAFFLPDYPVPEGGGEAKRFEVDAGASQGAVWMGGAAPVVDGSKHVWVATGNGSTTSGDPLDSDSVLKLSAGMELLDSFTPASWAHDNAADLDLGSTSPVLLPGQVVQAGKSRTAYVLKRGSLGGIGGQQLTVGSLCGNNFDGGSAFTESKVYLPCRNGTISATVQLPALERFIVSTTC
jgi:hypothetical protein